MPIDFPNSPATNDQFVSGGRTWIWDGSVWKAYTQALNNSTITSNMIVDGTIVNADISTSAAIAATKITGWEDDQVVLAVQAFI
jgi:hypothetical protein